MKPMRIGIACYPSYGGSGIVADSNAAAEYGECLLKGRFFLDPLPPLGLIETLLWSQGGGYAYLEGHLHRLAESALYFEIPCEVERVKGALLEFRGALDDGVDHRVRLVLSREGAVELSFEVA